MEDNFMAGAFTHWMIVERAIEKIDKTSDLGKVLCLHRPLVLLGSVSPDLPSLTDVATGALFVSHNWADRMHYEKTGDFVRTGVETLRAYRGRQRDLELSAVWLIGYASHVIADTLIHPVVNAAVGPYRFNATEHRECEMTQDSMIFKYVKNEELPDTRFHKIIKDASNRPNARSKINSLHIKEPVATFWWETLIHNYPKGDGEFDDIKPDEWFGNYIGKLGISTTPSVLFRHLGEEIELVYRKTDELSADQKNRYFNNVSIPGETSGSFIKVFDKTVAKVIEVWGHLWNDIQSDSAQNVATYIKNWDLDQGIDMDKPSLWV
jgi:hypothetical protein